MDMDTKERKRTKADAMGEIEEILTRGTMAPLDSFRLGQLVYEYGQICAGESASAILEPLIASLEKKTDKPW